MKLDTYYYYIILFKLDIKYFVKIFAYNNMRFSRIVAYSHMRGFEDYFLKNKNINNNQYLIKYQHVIKNYESSLENI